MKRKRMSRSGSKSYFSATASKSPAINYRGAPMRGGIRL